VTCLVQLVRLRCLLPRATPSPRFVTLSRRAGVTSGAIYGTFEARADLLVAAVDARILTDLDAARRPRFRTSAGIGLLAFRPLSRSVKN